ncbi:MAG TPA: M20/M25/M40 family metallo-hydrolase [Vicinamibacterales bacterium]|nr:M20/M25/M40 family metallo-hydrolase [Vicinamibacterales bacterium]
MRGLLQRRPLLAGSVLVAALTFTPLSAQQAPERVDLDAIYKIKQEGFQNSRVMTIMSWLTDVYGPRLTNSPGFRRAGEWAVKEMTSWGLTNVKLEPFGPFGRGWANERFYMMATTPGGSFPVIGYPHAWTTSTNGPVSGDAVLAVIETPEDIASFKGKLKGKMVLTQAMREVDALWDPPARRLTDEQLRAMESDPRTAARGGRAGRAGGPGQRGGGRGQAQSFARTRMQFLKDEGVLALVSPTRGDGGTVFVQSGPGVGSRDANADLGLPSVGIAIEHYGRIVRTLEKEMPVRIELDVRNSFSDDTMSFNVVGEIAGTDKAEELVMLGAHFDSWHGGTGATDNAAGSAVMMEAMRILKQSGLPLRRTVRIALWGGEEQGLLGSRAYVTEQFANRADMVLKPAHGKFSSYFNVDNGTGAIRGVYLQGNEAVAPIFEAWMKPFHNVGMTTLTIRNTGGTDHQSFDAVGLPGFQFIQDPVEYSSRTHHSNMDVYERIQEEDMKKNAVVVAAFVYHAANRDEKLPRKPLPRPQGGGRGTAPGGVRGR